MRTLKRVRSSTAVISFSCDLETINRLEAWSIQRNMSRSRSIAYLVRMGFVYTKILDDQEKERQLLAAGVRDGEEKPKSA